MDIKINSTLTDTVIGLYAYKKVKSLCYYLVKKKWNIIKYSKFSSLNSSYAGCRTHTNGAGRNPVWFLLFRHFYFLCSLLYTGRQLFYATINLIWFSMKTLSSFGHERYLLEMIKWQCYWHSIHFIDSGRFIILGLWLFNLLCDECFWQF